MQKGNAVRKLVVISLVLLLLTFPALAQDEFAELREVIETQLEVQNAPGLAVAVVFEDEIVFSEGFGVRSTETEEAVTPDTLFRIGSTTKPLTAIGLLRLIELGEVDLDESVSAYVPEFPLGDDITVRHLLSHTAGLRDDARGFGSLAADALETWVASLTPENALFADPGLVMSYSNPGFNIAGRVIEAVSGQPYADYMADEVFAPLGMDRSTLYSNIAITYPVAVGYTPGMFGLTTQRPNPDNAEEYPSGFVFSTAEDLAQLARFILNDGVVDDETVLAPELAAEMGTAQVEVEALNTAYGLGLFLQEYRSTARVGHGGAIFGYSSFFDTLPEYDLGVIVLANVAGFDAEPIFEAAVDALVELPAPEEPELHAPEALEDYTGSYEQRTVAGELLITIDISLDEDALTATVEGQPTLALRPTSPDAFDVYFGDMRVGSIAFVRGARGEIAFGHFGYRALTRVE
jgi:CubicO group peptidase (beta-lactamase class C family)